MYMDGRGVVGRTEKLCDQLWGALHLAWLGASAMVVGPLISWGLLIHRMPWDDPASSLEVRLTYAASFLCVVVGARGVWPWLKVRSEMRRHREAMEKETARRGEGWAQS
jgi:hypothetical protein